MSNDIWKISLQALAMKPLINQPEEEVGGQEA
jgi:hypothetical protein